MHTIGLQDPYVAKTIQIELRFPTLQLRDEVLHDGFVVLLEFHRVVEVHQLLLGEKDVLLTPLLVADLLAIVADQFPFVAGHHRKTIIKLQPSQNHISTMIYYKLSITSVSLRRMIMMATLNFTLSMRGYLCSSLFMVSLESSDLPNLMGVVCSSTIDTKSCCYWLSKLIKMLSAYGHSCIKNTLFILKSSMKSSKSVKSPKS